MLITLFHVKKVLINSHPGDNIYLPVLLSEGVLLLVLLETSGRLFGQDYQLLFDVAITIINVFLFLIVFVIPLAVIIFLIRKLVKYLDAKTKYYNNLNNNSMNDRQD